MVNVDGGYVVEGVWWVQMVNVDGEYVDVVGGGW